jgi:hypothetical protein
MNEKYIAFSISAGCYFYQLGIAYYLQQHFNLENIKFSGASGGSWPAVLLAAGEDIKQAFEYVITYAPECSRNRPILGAYMVYDRGIAIVFRKLWENVNLPALVNGKLALSVTRLAWDSVPYLKDEIVTDFYSNQDILECVIASALIPWALNGKPYVIYRNWICADGGITNVTGVRHFAEELVHDIELIEEELVEQAHLLTDDFVHTLQDEILYHGAADKPTNSPSTHRHLPITTGPKDIIQFGVTISMTIIDVITDSLERLLESRRQLPFNQSSNPETEHLLYRPTPLLLSSLEQHKSQLLQQVLSAIHPSCERIIERLHSTSTRLHDRYNHPSQDTTLVQKPSGGLVALCTSMLSSLTGDTFVFPDASHSISEIYSQETHWLGNYFSSYCEMQELFENHHSTEIPSLLLDNQPQLPPAVEALRIEGDENSANLSDAPVFESQTSSIQHLECKDYQEEDEDDESDRFRSSLTSINDSDELIEICGLSPSPRVTSSPKIEQGSPSLLKVFPSPSLSSKDNSSSTFGHAVVAIPQTPTPPGVGSVDEPLIHQGDSQISSVTETDERIQPHDATQGTPLSNDYWKKQGDIIKQIPNGGGLQLEISPWMWRHHSIWNYHLSADPMDAIKLFNMGINDAFDHHEELKRFFDI